jgi:SAM-dependent methyltransferase
LEEARLVRYAEPRRGLRPEDCIFYHALDLPGVGLVGTDWDLRKNADAYLGRLDYAGRTALDVGTATGFLTFEMEKRGASVTSFEMASPTQYQFVPYAADRPHREAQLERWTSVLERVKNGYWLAHERLGSKARAFYGDVYDLPEALGSFDVVILGMILPHLRDPMRALESAAARSRDLVVVSQWVFSDPRPFMALIPGPVATDDSRIAWWTLSDTVVRTFLDIVGFDFVKEERAPQKCLANGLDVECTAMVFRRRVLSSPA